MNDERGAVAVYSTGLRRGLGISAATSEREALELRIALCHKMASNGYLQRHHPGGPTNAHAALPRLEARLSSLLSIEAAS